MLTHKVETFLTVGKLYFKMGLVPFLTAGRLNLKIVLVPFPVYPDHLSLSYCCWYSFFLCLSCYISVASLLFLVLLLLLRILLPVFMPLLFLFIFNFVHIFLTLVLPLMVPIHFKLKCLPTPPPTSR